jgi:hypothetical protein
MTRTAGTEGTDMHEEGVCVQCGWTVTREANRPWTGRLGGDCRIACDGVHRVRDAEPKKRKRARAASGSTISVMMMNGPHIVYRQDMPGADGANWHEWFTEPLTITEIRVGHHAYRIGGRDD